MSTTPLQPEHLGHLSTTPQQPEGTTRKTWETSVQEAIYTKPGHTHGGTEQWSTLGTPGGTEQWATPGTPGGPEQWSTPGTAEKWTAWDDPEKYTLRGNTEKFIMPSDTFRTDTSNLGYYKAINYRIYFIGHISEVQIEIFFFSRI